MYGCICVYLLTVCMCSCFHATTSTLDKVIPVVIVAPYAYHDACHKQVHTCMHFELSITGVI